MFVLPQIESVKDFLFLLNKTDLEDLLSDWSEDASVGNIILKYVSLIITCFFNGKNVNVICVFNCKCICRYNKEINII